ncbi:MAG: GTPase [Candidatus Thermoplasmatota archaeon]
MPVALNPSERRKVCLAGEPEVGKTSLLRRLAPQAAKTTAMPTMDATVTEWEVPVGRGPDRVEVWLTIWDVVGSPGPDELADGAYFFAAQGVLAVGDLTRPATIRALPTWIEAARRVAGSVPVVVLGNRADLPFAPGADEALTAIGQAFEAPIWRASARSGENVEAAARGLAEAIVASSSRRRPAVSELPDGRAHRRIP